ncbi:MAG: S9 family peptidase, partial [Bdellovibrionales bacterium]|nr:S9 family peptidase [Bdellovibrionales bacterium]
ESNFILDTVRIKGSYLLTSEYLGELRRLRVIDKSGNTISNIDVPESFSGEISKYDHNSREVHLNLWSPIVRSSEWIYKIDENTWYLVSSKNIKEQKDPAKFMLQDSNGVEYESYFLSYKSKDSTRIPIRVTHQKGIDFKSNAPTLMQGYGGFGSNNYFYPDYNFMVKEFLKSGGVYLAPALRGSYFFGQAWHDAGRALNKQNVVDDFIYAAEWAIRQKITNPDRLVITGDSHGGLVVGAAITQRPDLFGMAIPGYGPHDFSNKPMLDPRTVRHQVYEYGDLINDPAAITNAETISPYLRIRPNFYPQVLTIEGRQDSRVNPVHSYKFHQKLSRNQLGPAPIQLLTLSSSGHWMGSLIRQNLIGWRATSYVWASIYKFLDLKVNDKEVD